MTKDSWAEFSVLEEINTYLWRAVVIREIHVYE